MNDALRILRKILRHYGYDIKKYYEYNLLPINNQNEINQLYDLSKAQKRSSVTNKNENLEKLYICLRTCLKEKTDKDKSPNVTGTSHDELVMRCMQSLVQSINDAVNKHNKLFVEFVIFDDHSDEPYMTEFSQICKNVTCKWEIKTNREHGQGASLLEQFEFAKDKNALFYFCEDDYLHELSAISEMLSFYKQIYNICGTHSMIHPQEHEFLYTKTIYPSYLLLGDHRHWRTISHATHVLFTHSAIVTKYWPYFEKTRFVGNKKMRRQGSEAQNTNYIFEHIPGFAPIPALAAHMQTENCIPPYFDWHKLWDKNRQDN